ncbi:hypothetical protein N3C_2406 [Clostridium sp. N3C]|nr:hypothetical protein N3C_2406 [Clostridium sp. N3C]
MKKCKGFKLFIKNFQTILTSYIVGDIIKSQDR